MKTIDFGDVPDNWALCFQDDCPMAATCLRFAVGEQMPEEVTRHMAVMKGARKGNACSMYREAQLSLIARGMTRLFDGLEPSTAIDIRKELVKLFSSRAHYYRYRAGKYPITPGKQEEINQIFRKYGVDHPAKFDHISMAFDFYDH